MDSITKFWSRVDKSGGPDACWIWQGAKLRRGYGAFTDEYGQRWQVHRFIFQYTYGMMLPGVYVCHRCDNPPCVNPKHLFPGTHSDNLIDMKRKGRSPKTALMHPESVPRGEKHARTRFTEAQIRYIVTAWRNKDKSAAELAQEFGVHKMTIYKYTERRLWKHLDI